MNGFGAVIYSRLKNDADIFSASNKNILPEFRSDLIPSIVYEYSVDSIDDTYDHNQSINYEVVISVVQTSYAKAVELADLIIANLDNENWEDSVNGYRIIEVHYIDRDEASVERNAKSDRVCYVDLRFNFRVTTED